jgi:hypothetical protein
MGFATQILLFVVATRSACDLQAEHARDSVIDGCRSILDAYDAGREAILIWLLIVDLVVVNGDATGSFRVNLWF